MSKELANTNTALDNFKDEVAYLSEVSTYLVENKLVPSGVKPHEISLIVNIGKELGMSPITSVNSITIIQGRACLNASVIPALLASKGVHIDVIKDYDPVIEKVKVPMRDPSTKEPLKDENGNLKFYKDDSGEYIYKDKIVDRVTTIILTRNIPGVGVMKRECSFKWSMAEDAGWTSKQNWKKLPAYMMMARCVTRAARLYAGDAINSMYDNYEMIDTFVDNDNIVVTEEGEIYGTQSEQE
jgi:hypothetical protein